MGHDYGATYEKFNNRWLHDDNEILLTLAIAELELAPNENILDPYCRNGSHVVNHLAEETEKTNGKVFALTKSQTQFNHAVKHCHHSNIVYLNHDLLDPELSFGGEKIQ